MAELMNMTVDVKVTDLEVVERLIDALGRHADALPEDLKIALQDVIDCKIKSPLKGAYTSVATHG